MYANKTERKMTYNPEMDEDEARELQNWQQNMFDRIFPQYEEKYGNNPNELDYYQKKNPQENDDYNENS